MNNLTTLAQYYYSNSDYESLYSTTTVSPADAAAAAGAFIFFMFLYFVLLAGIYVVYALFLSKIFKKANVPSWIAWVPFYNQWKLLEIGGQQGFWAVLSIIPFVNIAALVFQYIAMYHIGLKLGKQGPFLLFGIFLPLVWLIWLAVDTSKWDESKSPAKSLHHPAPAKPKAA